MNSKALANLILSPRWTAKLLYHFISGAQSISPDGIKTELLYLALPLLNDSISRKAIKCNAKSTFYTSFVKKSSLSEEEQLELKNSILMKNRQVSEYREFTNNGLVLLGNTVDIVMGEFCKVTTTISFSSEPTSIRDRCKSAHYLGRILAKEDYKNIFWKLGIVNI